VAKEIELAGSVETWERRWCARVASKTSDVAVDGNHHRDRMAQAIFRERRPGRLPRAQARMALKRGIEKAVEVAVVEIKKLH